MMNKINDAALETVTGGIIWPKMAAAPEGIILEAAPEKMIMAMRLDMRLDAVSAPWVRRFIDF